MSPSVHPQIVRAFVARVGIINWALMLLSRSSFLRLALSFAVSGHPKGYGLPKSEGGFVLAM
jgi:hypothetical protein